MKLTKENVKKVIAQNFENDVDLDLVSIKKWDGSFHALSKPQGLNVIVDDDPRWVDALVAHIKWQLDL